MSSSDWLNRTKSLLKRYPRLYKSLITIISPVCPNGNYFKKLLSFLPEDSLVINIGSGPFRLHAKIINIDLEQYNNVDIVADANHLPFKDESIDGIISIVLLEHVPDSTSVIKEMNNILKPGGFIYACVPFIQGYHASPHDYLRWTSSGVKKLFEDYEQVEMGTAGGPTSSLVWIFQEWAAILLSFNIRTLYTFWVFLFMLATFPLKFLDLVLRKYKFSENIASNFYYIGRKRSEN